MMKETTPDRGGVGGSGSNTNTTSAGTKSLQQRRRRHDDDDVYDDIDKAIDKQDQERERRKSMNTDADPDGTHDVVFRSSTSSTSFPRETDDSKNKNRKKKEDNHDDDDDKIVAERLRIQKVLETVPEDVVQQYALSTSQVASAKRRRKMLALDDTNPDYTNVHEKHIRSLDRRRKYSHHNKVAQTKLERIENKRLKAAVNAIQGIQVLQNGNNEVGTIIPETDIECTRHITQLQLKNQFIEDNDEEIRRTARYIHNIQLNEPFGPYGIHYDRSGRYMGLYSTNGGHVAVMDNYEQTLKMEFNLSTSNGSSGCAEKIRDFTFLHNHTLAAIAQKNLVYIYDTSNGAEVHCLREHYDPMALQFLPYHWLLASIGRNGTLRYQDTSTGELISSHYTKMGCCRVLCQNPTNAVLHSGHTNGSVALWSPSTPTFLVKMLCHPGASVTAVAVDNTGHTMVTSGVDRTIRVWDLRMFKERFRYYTDSKSPAVSLDISQRGMLAVGHAGRVTIWSPDAIRNKVKSPYMDHVVSSLGGKGPVQVARFRPYEDVCGIGHAGGISSIVIPGSGEPTIDTSEYNTNPHQDTKQRREAEVRALLDKLSPDMIALDPDHVGSIDVSNPHRALELLQQQLEEDEDEKNNENGSNNKHKKVGGKRRGRSKTQTQLRRKHAESNTKLSEKVQASQTYKDAVAGVLAEEEAGDNNNIGSNSKKKYTNDDNVNHVRDNDQNDDIILDIVPHHHQQQQQQQQPLPDPILDLKEAAPSALKRFF